MASQLTSPNVGGDPERQFCKKKSTNRILIAQNLSVESSGVVVRFHVHKIKKFLMVRFLKLQPDPISVLLALNRGCMAYGSHSVRMDQLF